MEKEIEKIIEEDLPKLMKNQSFPMSATEALLVLILVELMKKEDK